MKNFFLKMLLFVPVPILIIGINYSIDPAHLFSGGKFERGLAQLLLEKQDIKGIANFDDRLVQKFYLAGCTERKDVIVLGSSRSIHLGSEFFPREAFFNSSVWGASLEDLIAIYGMYHNSGRIPGTVVIGLDPWILNRNSRQNRWYSIRDEYYAAASLMAFNSKGNFKIGELLPQKLITLFSLDYFSDSLTVLKEFVRHPYKARGKPAAGVVNDEEKNTVKYADGSFTDGKEDQKLTREESEKEMAKFVENKADFWFGGFLQLDPVLAKRFETFIRFMERDGARVIFFLPPFHPDAYRFLVSSENFSIIPKVQEYFVRYAKSRNIPVYGSYDPLDYGLTWADFSDALHAKPAGLKRCFEKAKK